MEPEIIKQLVTFGGAGVDLYLLIQFLKILGYPKASTNGKAPNGLSTEVFKEGLGVLKSMHEQMQLLTQNSKLQIKLGEDALEQNKENGKTLQDITLLLNTTMERQQGMQKTIEGLKG